MTFDYRKTAGYWLAEIAEALGRTDDETGAPQTLTLEEIHLAICELRDERDEWKHRAENAESDLLLAKAPKRGNDA